MPVFPLRKFNTEQIFVLVHIQLCNHVHTQRVKRFKWYWIRNLKTLQVRENEISLRK